MNRNKYVLVAAALLLITVTGFQIRQDPDFLQKLKKSLRGYNTTFPEEKVYLQLDKPFYKPGDDIWFNAFVLNSNTNRPTDLSDVVYVELIDPKGAVASRLELIITHGAAPGDFTLQKTAPGGLYRIRAFTQWMKNFGKENAFKKEIQVQRIITPRILLKLDFGKESYGPGDSVSAKLTITNLRNEKAGNATIDFAVKINGVKIAQSKIFSNAQGLANICFRLPDTLNTTDGLLEALIATQGVEESISRSIPIILNKIALQFFPEGGRWVNQVSTRIAFKALNEFGKGADISGFIVDQDNLPVTRFESFHMGMGSFELRPVTGRKYFARIDRPSGNTSLIPLPEAGESGLTLNLIVAGATSCEWRIHSPTAKAINLVGQSHGEIVYAGPIDLVPGENSVIVPTESFPAGIAVFTLFDSEGAEQCERLVFVNSDRKLSIRLKTDKKQYLPREQVLLKIMTVDDRERPVPARLSLAVADDQLITFADDKQDNILSSMLLSSEVRGEIQEPSFYFDPGEPKAAQALDFLLMTQGWRRFTWKEVHERKREITFEPERLRNLAGRTVNKLGDGISAEVTLLEVGNKRRIVNVTPTGDGYFVFKNIDPTIPLLLLTKKPAEIVLQKEKVFSISLNDKAGTVLLPEVKEETTDLPLTSEERSNAPQVMSDGGLNLSLTEDVQQLSEVIVTAYGFENKRAIAASISTIYDNSVEGKFSGASMENLMQGRVAGLMVQPQTGSPGSQSNLVIRGTSSFAGGRGEPLYVIDGHVIGTSLNQNFSNGSMLGPEDIQTIEVINSPEATALFGSGAANGVILITTRSRVGYSYFGSRQKPARYSSLRISPRKFSPTREFYVPPPTKKANERHDFRSTVYWNPAIVTDNQGEATVSFYNNDAVSSFRMTAEGFSGSGLLGRNEESYHTELPFSMDSKLPEYLGFEDVLKLPVQVKNETASVLTGRITLTIPPALSLLEPAATNIQIKPQSAQTFWYTLTTRGVEGEFPVSLKLESPGYDDEIRQSIRIQPVGFPMRLSFSAKELDKTIRFSVHDAERNSMKAELTAFPDVLSDLFTSAESILQAPHGCFEQVSSSTFPNILALQFLNQSGLVRPDVERLAVSYIQDGYNKLVAYEISGGGFEWFGHPPAHEGLSAYGLIQFHEMKKVFHQVDEKMMDRTRDWLLSRRTGKGGYKQNAGKYGFSAASVAVNNAYITYALSETGSKDILPEYREAYAEVLESKDLYRMALVANTAFNLGKEENYNNLVNAFKERISRTGFNNLKIDHSIVRSYDNSLLCETVSLWVVALLKNRSADHGLIDVCIRQILNSRSFGQFGSTQATTLALKALTEYARLVRTTRDNGEIEILLDGRIAEQRRYEREVREKLILTDFAKSLKPDDEQTLRIHFNETSDPLPYSVNIQWHTKLPPSGDQCKVNLTTALSSTSIQVNETVRLTVTLKNKSSEGLPMTVAVIGIPAGLSPQPWQLKELQEKEIFDFYEIMGGNLIVYYREMAPRGTRTIHLDLKAEIPGTYLGAASSAYLYYTSEQKHWIKGNSITIN